MWQWFLREMILFDSRIEVIMGTEETVVFIFIFFIYLFIFILFFIFYFLFFALEQGSIIQCGQRPTL
jgi:hypothetical protein